MDLLPPRTRDDERRVYPLGVMLGILVALLGAIVVVGVFA
jgi:hypothetical protein